MLSAELASSLSCDFSRARRAASFTSLNFSENFSKGDKQSNAAEKHLEESVLYTRILGFGVILPGAAAALKQSRGRTQCWPCCPPTGRTSGTSW